MKILTLVKSHCLKCFNKYFSFMLGIFITSNAFCDSTDPLAATVLPQVKALFGPTSTISYCIYLAEIVVGAVGYVKTKNLLILIGVPILVIFTSAMLSNQNENVRFYSKMKMSAFYLFLITDLLPEAQRRHCSF